MLTEHGIQALKQFLHLGVQVAVQKSDGTQACAVAVMLNQKLDKMLNQMPSDQEPK